MDKASESERFEVLAFELFINSEAGKKATDTAKGGFELWRTDGRLREAAYKTASAFQEQLKAVGLRVRVGNSRVVRERLAEIMTIPPRLAYDLPGHASFSQDGPGE